MIFYHTPAQQAAAEELKATDQSGRFKKPIVTQIEAAPTFYPAEDYHQRYLEKRGLSHCEDLMTFFFFFFFIGI